MSFEADAPLVAHDEPLGDDEIFDLRLNHVWRRIVGGILTHAMEYIAWSGSAAEIEQANNWYSALIEDFYDDSLPGGVMNYAGVLASVNVAINFGTSGVIVQFTDVVSTPNHDTDGFFVDDETEALIVPAGLGGFYRLYAWARFDPNGTNTAWLEIAVNAVVVAEARWRVHLQASPEPGLTIELVEGDEVTAIVRTASGTRAAVPVGGRAWSVRLGMYRVGI